MPAGPDGPPAFPASPLFCSAPCWVSARPSVYYRPAEVSQESLEPMRLIDRQYLATPFYGSRRMVA